jgi:hypothetical protein
MNRALLAVVGAAVLFISAAYAEMPAECYKEGIYEGTTVRCTVNINSVTLTGGKINRGYCKSLEQIDKEIVELAKRNGASEDWVSQIRILKTYDFGEQIIIKTCPNIIEATLIMNGHAYTYRFPN